MYPSTISDKEAYRVLKPGGKLLISHAEALTIPLFSGSDFFDYRRANFEDIKLFPGMPSTAFYALY